MPRVKAEVDRPSKVNRSERPQRVPINGLRDKLSIKGQEEGFHYVIVNDYNVDTYVLAGYDFVTHDVTIGDRSVNTAQSEGGKASIPVGNGVIGFIMRIPNEFYEEDRAEEQRDLDDKEKAMRRRLNSKDDGQYGGIRFEERMLLKR